MLNSVNEGLDKPNHYAHLSAVDFTIGFDRVNHTIVIKKLIDLGVRRSIVPIVCCFLTGCTHNSKLSNHVSSLATISYLHIFNLLVLLFDI